MNREVYYECLEQGVPSELKAWGVWNFMIVRLPAAHFQEQIALLANAPSQQLFDTQVWHVCEAIPDLVTGLTRYHWTRAMDAQGRKSASARSALVRVERQRLELELEKVWTRRYDPDKVGRLLDLAVDYWPRRDLSNLLEDLVRDLLNVSDDWKEPEKVAEIIDSWPPEARASVARAYLAMGDVKVADKILNPKS